MADVNATSETPSENESAPNATNVTSSENEQAATAINETPSENEQAANATNETPSENELAASATNETPSENELAASATNETPSENELAASATNETPSEIELATDATNENGIVGSRLPVYCFQTTETVTEPAWCTEGNSEYVQQCQELDGLQQQYTVELNNVTNGNQLTKVVVYFDSGKIQIGEGTYELTITHPNLRYCYIITPITEVDTHRLIISYWEGDYREQIKNRLFNADRIEDSIKLMNCIRRLIYLNEKSISEPARVLRFFPYMIGKIAVFETKNLSLGINDAIDNEYRDLFVTVDDEVILVYGGDGVSEKPKRVLRFLKDSVDEAIERIYAHNVSKEVEIDTSNWKFLFRAATADSEVFKAFCFYVQGRILPKQSKMFDFSDASEFGSYMASHPVEHYSPAKPQFVPAKLPTKKPDFTSHRRTSDADDMSEISSMGGGRSGSLFESEDNTHDMSRLDDLIRKLETSTDNLDGISEDTQMMWITIEAEIEDKTGAGLVPESTIQSGGLDPNSASHFEKIIDEIQMALFTECIDRALSHMQGCGEVFSKSDNKAVTKWLQHYTETDRLRQIYLAGRKP